MQREKLRILCVAAANSMHRIALVGWLVASCSAGLVLVAPTEAQVLEWVQTWGTSDDDYGSGVSADVLGNVFFTGQRYGSVSDAFVGKFNAAGELQWASELATDFIDSSRDISADGLGSVYIAGFTEGSLGGPNIGASDAFVSKYDATGAMQWTRQLGTGATDSGEAVSADGLGNVYVSGDTFGSLGGPNAGEVDAFVSKYDAAGTLQWSKQLGTGAYDRSTGVAADGLGNVYVSGRTEGSLGSRNAGSWDAFVSKYDAAGNLQWTRQLGTNTDDRATGISADTLGNVYISGHTHGELDGPNAGLSDAFVSKYDASGTLKWTRQLGTKTDDYASGVSTDGLGNVYIAGTTYGSLVEPNEFNSDAFVSKYNAAGVLQWARQLGSSSFFEGSDVSFDGLGNVYLSGTTDWKTGFRPDSFVAKYSIPEPGTLMLTMLTGAGILLRRTIATTYNRLL